MPFRRATGIVSNLPSSDPKTEADVIMTAAALGFAASYIEKDAFRLRSPRPRTP